MLKFNDERDLQRQLAKKLTQGDFSFRVASSNFFCDVLDPFLNIFIEVKVKGKFAAAQLLYGAVREYGNGIRENFIPQIFGLATPEEIRFFKVPEYEVLKDFYNQIDPTGILSPSVVPKSFNAKALSLLGEPIHINTYDSPLDFSVPYIFISSSNIFYIISRLEKYDISITELISKIADVWIGKGEISLIKKGGIVDTIDGSVVPSKPIKPQDEAFIKALRITPHDLEHLSAHLDEYREISSRRKLGKFYTGVPLSNKVSDIIRKYVEPELIVEPFAGTGSLLLPFTGTPTIANDISKEDIEVAKLSFEGYPVTFFNDDVLAYSASELISRWGISSSPLNLFYFNPPFGTSATNTLRDSSVEKGKSRKIEIKYRDELLKYGKGDLCYPAIGQIIEMIKSLGSGYLAFYSPFDLFCGRVRYNKLLLELLSNFTFCEGTVLSGEEFNNVAKDKPIAFTVWKLGSSTKHLDLVFDCYDKKIRLKKGFLLKEGWAYDIRDTDETTLYISPKAAMNEPSPPLFSIGIRKGDAKPYGSRVIKENVKKDLSFDI